MDKAELLKNTALRAIEAVFGDTSVPPERTLELMTEIVEVVEEKIDVLREDIAE